MVIYVGLMVINGDELRLIKIHQRLYPKHICWVSMVLLYFHVHVLILSYGLPQTASFIHEPLMNDCDLWWLSGD